MSHLYYLVGPPGAGKRTVGLALSARTGAALLDNHLFNDPIFRAYGADGVSPLPDELFELAEVVRQAGLAALRLAPRHLSYGFRKVPQRVTELFRPEGAGKTADFRELEEHPALFRMLRKWTESVSHILTNHLSGEERGHEVVAQLRALAAERGVVFVPVWLACPQPELEARMGRPERTERLKLRDPELLRALLERGGTLAPPPDALVLNTAELHPDEAARRIVHFARSGHQEA
ncbi:hypothetical protein [Deinococcus arcticus]|uniref:Shikimate kinase n=1 Tax=Deinococcus arcticus TaxID=2136176 RepID=A0A2T3WAV9_9DEIO|nr:hypothetical protein [Deinococcus arcticus]PTA69041.1 hypothetical protein C8263_04410 [Deinococcus arcticus]